jgi:hypothetical protein
MKYFTVRGIPDSWNCQARIDLGDMQQRLGLHVQQRRILGRVRDLENPLASIFGA